MKKLILTLLVLSSCFFPLRQANCSPGSVRRSSGLFQIDRRLQPRVDFWIDIFTKYGKDHAVIHHRMYPQVVFKVLDFSNEARVLNAVQMERHKNAAVKREVSAVESIMRHLGSGAAPRTPYEREIVDKMEFIPGAADKYRRALKDDMIRSQTGIKEKYAAAIKRSGRYLPMMERVFEDYGLPVELTRLPFIESSFDYSAYSSVGAAGLWQFMPKTAKFYKMTVTSTVDDRRDPVKATHGAAKYLSESYARLESWPLAITSYNHGPAGVSRAIKKAGTTDIADLVEDHYDRVFGFASSNFYPEFLAAVLIYDNYQHYFPGLVKEPAIQFDQISLPQALSVKTITKQLGLSTETLKEYNYALTKAVWDGRYSVPAGFMLKVPVGTGILAHRLGTRQVAESTKSASSIYGGTTYKVRPGDTLSSISKKLKVSVSELRKNNNLTSDRLRVGQQLVIKERETDKAVATPTPKANKEGTSEAKSPAVVPTESSGTVYTVKKGDSLWSIAKQFRVGVDDLKKRNKIAKSSIKAGDKLIIP